MAQVSSIYDKWFLKNQNFRQKFHILLILTEKNASKWLEWHIFEGLRSGAKVPVKSKWQKFDFLLFDLKKCQNGLSGTYLGSKACRMQWHRFPTIKSKISGKNFTFCWFWLRKMHQNGLSGMYLGFEVCQIQWHWVSSLYNKQFLKNQNFRQKFHLILTEKCIIMA